MPFPRAGRLRRNQQKKSARAELIETLETRTLMSVTYILPITARPPVVSTPITTSSLLQTAVASTTKTTTVKTTGISHPIVAVKKSGTNKPATSSGPVGFSPAAIRQAYGIDQITFGSIVGDGTGQTIAIINAYDDPTAFNDVNAFSSAFNLPTLASYTGNNTTPYFRKVDQTGGTNYPTTDPAGPNNANGTWEEEESLDIEWAHAVAPMANIILIEASSPSNANLMTAALTWARSQPTISVVSMSFGSTETSNETSFDSLFTTPSGHIGMTFVASTGDDAAPAGYPSYSPNVVAVGGTSLFVNSSTGNYSSESGWADGGGGISTVESKPSYQSSVTQSTTKRTAPDVSLDADPNTGVAVYDSYDFGTAAPWAQFGGTSLSAPMFAALVAIADQGRVSMGLSTLDGATQTLPAIYAASTADFHDVTTGNNGFAAGTGYDLVTGRGSPIANLLIPALATTGTISGTVYSDNDASATLTSGDVGLSGVTVFLDTNGNGILDNSTATSTTSSGNVSLNIPDNRTSGVTSSLTVTSAGTVNSITINFNITHTFDGDLIGKLTSPTGTVITLFSRVGGSGDNFTNTTLDSTVTNSITAGTAPFTGTFSPSPGSLTAFIGQSAAGVWKFNVADVSVQDIGKLVSWSITLNTGNNEPSTVTDSSGHYILPVSSGAYKVTEILPTGYVATTPTSGNVTIASNGASVNFGVFPTVLNAAGANDSFFMTVDPNNASRFQIYSGSSATGTPTYSAALTLLSSTGLTFNLLNTSNIVTIDFTNGSPFPPPIGANITVNGNYSDPNQELRIIAGDPNAQFNMTDFQIGPAAGSNAVLFNTLPTLTLFSGTFNYTGQFNTLENLNINNGSTFIWN